MSELVTMLERLGLSQYLQPFVDEGFDTWETLMDITESDLEALNVKLGHRRKLQRAIIEARGKTRDNMAIGAPHPLGPKEEIYRSEEDGGTFSRDHKKQVLNNNNVNPTGQKRKYRRHPKADETAPERPPSAYVIFSNQMRDKLKGQDLSFTEIAKIVGERWQVLASHEKEPCERQAQKLKEKYYIDLIEYKKTPQYAQYQEYLAEFKAKHNQQTDNKKSKPESDEPDVRQNGGGDSTSRVQFSPSSPSNTYDPSGNDWRRSESPASRKSPTYGSARNQERSPITPPVPNFRRFPVGTAYEEGTAHEEDSRPQALPLPLLPGQLSKHSSESRSTGSHDLNSPHTAPYNRINTNEPRRSPPRRGTLSNDDVPGLLRDDTKSAVSSDRSYAASPWMNQPYSLPAMEVMHGNKSRVLPVPLPRTNTNNGNVNDRASGLSPPAPQYSVLNGNHHLSDRRDFRSKSSIATLLEAGEQIDRDAEKKIGPTADFRGRDRLWERE